ncbi:hypothetical protein GF314_08590 [bacterium]|nr:hypothetical protein [bacterium]
MSKDYRCPRCEAVLNPDRSVILVAAHGPTRALIGFHPEPGNYEVYLPPGVAAEQGSRWDFSCPLCHADLAAAENEDLCELELREDDATSRLLFSRIAGEQATFVLREDHVEQAHGSDAVRFDPIWAQLKYIRI